LCAIGLAVVAVLAWHVRRSPALAGPVVGAAALLVVALSLTSSRGSWAALAAALFVVVAGRRRANAALVVAAGLAAVGAVTAVTTLPRLLQARGDHWHAAGPGVRRHPLGGSGAG